MSLSRRFLNVVMNYSIPGTRSLRCTTRGDFFYPPGTPTSTASAMEQIRLPSPTMSFKTSGISCLPISDRKVLCTGRSEDDAFVFDANTRHVVTVPAVDKPKWKPVFVPSAGGGDDPDPEH